MSKRVIVMLAGVAALAMLVAGCGGGDEETLTKAEFVEQGDAICKEMNDEVRAEFKKFAEENGIKEGEAPSPKQLEQIAEELYLPAVEARLASLQDLNPPEEEAQQVEKMLSAAEKGVDKAQKQPGILFAPSGSAFEEANEIAKDLGFKICRRT